MTNWTTLKAAIADVIKTNGNKEITGQVLQNTLNSIVSSVGENATFAGIATPVTNPGAPDGPVFYLAHNPGVYSNFDGITLEKSGLIIFYNTSSGNWESLKVYEDNNTRVSHIGYITCDYSSIIVSDDKVKIKGIDIHYGIDIYYNTQFYRFIDEQTITEIPSGSAVFYFNQDTNTFGITLDQSQLYNCIELGRFYGGKPISIYGKYQYNGDNYHWGVAVPTQNMRFENNESPASQQQVILSSNYTAIVRGEIWANGSDIILGEGDYYFHPRLGSVEYTTSLSEKSKYTLGKNEALAFNINTKAFNVMPLPDITIYDIICFFSDGAIGLCEGVGVLYPYLFKIDNSGVTSKVNSPGNAYSPILPVSNGDTIEVTTYANRYNTHYVFQVFDSNYKFLDGWTIPNNNRTITINLESAAYMIVEVSITSKKSQSIKRNGMAVFTYNTVESAAESAVESAARYSAYIVKGYVHKNGTKVTIINGDIYINRNYDGFYRLTADDNLSITLTGSTGSIWYNPITKSISIKDNATYNYEAYFGITDGESVYLNGSYKYTNDSDGNTMYNYISSLDIKNIVGSSNTDNIPSFVFENGQKTYTRLMNWCGNESNVFLLAQVTDVHSEGSNKYKVVGWLNELNKLFNFNVMGNFGDIGLDTSSITGDKEATYSLVVNTKKQMSSNSPWIFMKGNHEIIEANGIISENIYGEIFNKATRRNYPQLVLSSNGSYGYIDDVNTKTRTIILNTSDVSTGVGYKISVEQLQWLIEAINNTSNGYKIVVVSHLCIDDIGRWASYPADASGSGFDTLRSILNSIANHTDGSNSSTGLSWDFTNKTSVKLVCSLAGDSHFNNYIKRDGVNYIVRQGYGGISESEMPEGSSRDNFSWDSICNFDVLAIKQDGNAKIFRIGIGEENRDLEFTF